MVERGLGYLIQMLQTNREGEYNSLEFTNFYEGYSIER